MAILIVDDAADSRLILERMLKCSGHPDVVGADSSAQTLAILQAREREIEVILLDIMLPDIDGIELCRKIKRQDNWKDIPVLMVTALSGGDDLQAAFDVGAADYIVKPVQIAELVARLRSALALKREMDWRKHREQELLRTTHELEMANLRLQRLSSLDGLTEIPNRRALDNTLDRAWRHSIRKSLPLALLMVDIDHFKFFNDSYGHQKGDDCLKRIAATLTSCVRRPMDLAARYGGEEFAVVLSETDESGAINVAENLRQRVEDLQIAHASSPVAPEVTVSIGVASTLPGTVQLPSNLIESADLALYQAKRGGRNRVWSAATADAASMGSVPSKSNAPMGQPAGVMSLPGGTPGPHWPASPSAVRR